MEQLEDICFETQQALVMACRDHDEYLIEQTDAPDLPVTEDPTLQQKITLSNQHNDQQRQDLGAQREKN